MAWGSVTLENMMDLLTPKVADITDDGLSLSGDVTAEELELTEADASLSGPLAVGLDLRAVDGTVCVTGVVEGTAVRQCVRCLKDFEEPIAFSVRVAYEREPKTPPSMPKREDGKKKKLGLVVDVESEEHNDDIYHYVGDQVELGPMLREQLILSAPMHPLCTEDCLGLCPRCGKDLNTGPCCCAVEPTGGPFDILQKLKEKHD